MSNRRSMLDFPRNEAGLVSEFIGTAYDVVKGVHDNLPELLQVEDFAKRAETAAEVLDDLTTSSSPTFIDQHGQERKTWSGFEKDFQTAQENRDVAFQGSLEGYENSVQEFLERSGFYPIGEYAAGLVFTARNQYTVKDNYAYRLAPSTEIPFTLTGDWATDQASLVLFNQEDVLRADLAKEDGATRVGYKDQTVDLALGIALPIELPSIAAMATAGLRAKEKCVVNGTLFEVTNQKPRDVRMPVITVGPNLYAVPTENALDLRLGSFVRQGSVTDAGRYAKASNKSHQGAVIDNQVGSIFLTSADTPDGAPQSGAIHEYQYTNNTIGALRATSGNVDYGSGVFTPDSAARSLLPVVRAKLAANAGALKVLCYGDSVTWGWNGSVGSGQVPSPYPSLLNTRLTAMYQDMTISVVNKGNSGWRSTEALANLAAEVTSQAPDVVLVMFGINDCQGSSFGSVVNISQYKTNLAGIVDGIRAAGSEVAIMAPTPLFNANSVSIVGYAAAAKEVAISKNAAFVDTQADITSLLTLGYEAAASLAPDNVHFAVDKYFNISDIVYGRLFSKAAGLAYGHGDFIAVVDNGANRHIWYHRPTGAGTYAGGGALVRLPWADGVTESAVDRVIPLRGWVDSRRAEVQNYDAEHLSIRGEKVYICKISDLELGLFQPVQTLEGNPTPQGLTAIQPQQQFAHMAGYWFGYSGAFRKRKLNGFLLAGSMSGELHGSYIYDPTVAAEAELEGLCWKWNSSLAKYETCLTDFIASTGEVVVYNQATGTDRQYERSFPLMQRKATSSTAAQWTGGALMVQESPNPIAAPALLVGGYGNAASSNTNEFDPEDFRLEQFYSQTGGRKGARIRAFKDGDLIFDGKEDTNFGAGIRGVLKGVNCFHFRPDGLHVGDSHQTSAQLGKVQARGTSALPVFYTTVANVGYYSNGAFDYTVEEGTTMQLGSWNSTTKVGTIWYNASLSSFSPNTDNTKDLGTAGNRWAVVRAGTSAINTSDGRLKQQVRELNEVERAVAVRLKGLIRAFKFNDAVEKKGDGARIHVGVIAQEVMAAFEAEGLVAEDYAILCYDEWEETPEEVNEDGVVVVQYSPAGNCYGVRYEELLAFMLATL